MNNRFFTDDSRIICAFSSRSCGNMSLNYADTKDSLGNRKKFLAGLGIDYRDLVCAKQIHSNRIQLAKSDNKGRGAQSYGDSLADTDGLLTDKKNLPLAIFSADCLSMFLYEPKKQVIGLLHAGWKGARDNIAQAAVSLMKQAFNIEPAQLYIGLGPAIRGCCYEVGEEFGSIFPAELTAKGGRKFLDLARINKERFLREGVKQENIFDSNICTSCRNREYFSYRKEGALSGRVMSVIMLK